MTFLVWKRGHRGPEASKDELDPRQLADWKLIQQTTIQIIPLEPPYSGFHLDSLIVCFPCPPYEALS